MQEKRCETYGTIAIQIFVFPNNFQKFSKRFSRFQRCFPPQNDHTCASY